MKQPPTRRRPSGFTLIELLVVVSIIVALLALLLPSMGRAIETTNLAVCMSNQRQMSLAHTMYASDNFQIMMRLHRFLTLPDDPIVDSYGPLCWPDMMRPYTSDNREMFDCPSAPDVPGVERRFGIGMNHIQMSYAWSWITKEIYKQEIRSPSASVLFADTGRINNYNESDPDKWFEDLGVANLFFFLTPDHPAFFDGPTGPGAQRRMFNRHGDRAATVHLDGHGEAMPVSRMGFQFWGPTATNDARGDSVVGGGNDKYDPRWLWDRY